jgi:hypothetical protein
LNKVETESGRNHKPVQGMALTEEIRVVGKYFFAASFAKH